MSERPKKQENKHKSPELLQLPYDLETKEVLYGLSDFHGHDIGQPLVYKSVLDKNLTEIHIIGKPGNGKTVVVAQYKKEIDRISEIISPQYGFKKVRTIPILFDDIRYRMIQKFGIPTLSWKRSHWEELNDEMVRDKEQALASCKPDERVIVICESVVVGLKDRGRSALLHTTFPNLEEVTIGDASEILPVQKDKENLLVVAVLADRRIQDAAVLIRMYMDFVALNEEDLRGLKTKLSLAFNVDVGEAFDDSVESGKKLAEIFSRMAKEEHMAMIQKEVDTQVAAWRTKYGLQSNRMIEEIQLPNEVENEPFAKSLRNEAAYYEHQLLHEFKLGRANSIVAFSPFLQDRKIHLF